MSLASSLLSPARALPTLSWSGYAEQLRRELVLVPGVGKVAIGGAIPQQINTDISLAKMTARGITLNQLAAILSRLNVVSNAGEIKSGSESIRLHPTGV